jgi:hypothetical protein
LGGRERQKAPQRFTNSNKFTPEAFASILSRAIALLFFVAGLRHVVLDWAGRRPSSRVYPQR